MRLDELNIPDLVDVAWDVLGRTRTVEIALGSENSAEIAKVEIAAAMKSADAAGSE